MFTFQKFRTALRRANITLTFLAAAISLLASGSVFAAVTGGFSTTKYSYKKIIVVVFHR